MTRRLTLECALYIRLNCSTLFDVIVIELLRIFLPHEREYVGSISNSRLFAETVIVSDVAVVEARIFGGRVRTLQKKPLFFHFWGQMLANFLFFACLSRF